MCKPFQPRQSTGIFDKVFWADLTAFAVASIEFRARPARDAIAQDNTELAALIGLACRSRTASCALFKKQCENWRRPLRRLAKVPSPQRRAASEPTEQLPITRLRTIPTNCS